MDQQRNPQSLREALNRRAAEDAERILSTQTAGVDLCSNDYLGVARDLSRPEVIKRVLASVCNSVCDQDPLGATGSRLVSGTTEAHLELESYLATFYRAEAALLFGSGYEANVGLLGSIGRRGDTILYDDLVHASMRDGIRLGVSRAYSFAHNDLDDLRKKLRQARGDIYVAVEAVYSMDGHKAPLGELVSVCREFGAYLIVDEAHSSGVHGAEGEGLCAESGIADEVFARVHTFGKALGFRGACIVGSADLRRFLINFSRPFIYSTAPDKLSLAFIREAHEFVKEASDQRRALGALIVELRMLKEECGALSFTESESSIQSVLVPGNRNVLAAERALHDAGIFTKAIRSPTVPEGSERIRFSIHSFNTLSEIRAAFNVVRNLDVMRRAG